MEGNFTISHYEGEASRHDISDGSARHDNTAERIVRVTAEVTGVTLEQIRSTTRGQREVVGRTVAVHCASALGVSGRGVANVLRLSQQRVSVLRRQTPCAEIRSLCREVSRRLDELSGSSGA